MTDPKHALAHLLDLADKGPALRAALAEELAALLGAWPREYPAAMRATCEALREKVTREIGAGSAKRDVQPDEQSSVCDGGLVAAARVDKDFLRTFADRLGISSVRAEGIFADRSGRALTIACKGAHLGHPAYSAITILSDRMAPRDEMRVRLAAYETVPMGDAERTFHAWRAMDRFSHADK